MTDYQKKKAEYVAGALAAAVTVIANVSGLEYFIDRGEEFVKLTYDNGYSVNICVTADSLAATAHDVFKYIMCH